ncbi:MAG TPA: metallophosphoesterase [Conexibacter sp.]|nr:metallophosphoesterase [Conexibacter sp.]
MRLGVLSDLHWSVAPQTPQRWHAPYDFDRLAAHCAKTVDALVARGCEALVIAGDVTHDGDAASCDAALECILSVSPIPVAVVEGNHDVLRDRDLVSRRADVRDGWCRAEAVAHEQLVALRAVGVDRDDRWVRDRAQRTSSDGLATVLVSHFPLVPHTARLAAAGLPCPGELADRALLLELLTASRLPAVVLSGHVHVRDTAAHDNVLQICVPALVERPHEAAIVDVDPFEQVVRCMRIRGDGPIPEVDAERWLLAPLDERWELADG